ncbi:hypothetical protein MAR_025050 [Mya arenaria]|uniref:Uncharacterized protein n=1 Tax=Mya arenaria TaxID=6604 RepID=A0ABY7DSJ4_MYAAR|nr:hypothetical protein MAR_025050 [Mya arenaria]
MLVDYGVGEDSKTMGRRVAVWVVAQADGASRSAPGMTAQPWTAGTVAGRWHGHIYMSINGHHTPADT